MFRYLEFDTSTFRISESAKSVLYWECCVSKFFLGGVFFNLIAQDKIDRMSV